MKASFFLILMCALIFVSPIAAQDTDPDSVKLLRELVAVRDANFGKITSWKGEVSLRNVSTSGDVETVLSRQVQFVFDAITQNYRNLIRLENQGIEKEGYIPINEIALMQSDHKFFTLHSFLHNATGRTEIEYRPVEVFASITDVPGSGEFFNPIEQMDYSPASEDVLKLFLAKIDRGEKFDPKMLNITKTGEKVTLKSGSATWIYALNEGGLVDEYNASKPFKDLWKASHIEIDGIWLPAKIHAEQHFPNDVITRDLTWTNQEVNFPTEGEFTIAKLGGFRGHRMFDHIQDTQVTLTGAEYPPPPKNLWDSRVIKANPDKSKIRWLIWANILILIVVAVVIFFMKKRPNDSVRADSK